MYIEFLSHELPFNIRSTVVFLTARLAGAVMTPGHTVAKHTQTPPFPHCTTPPLCIFLFGMNSERVSRCIDSLSRTPA